MNVLTSEYNPYYKDFVAKSILFPSIETAFIDNLETTKRFFLDLPLDKLDYKYQDDKWTIKDVLQHLIDVERVYGYRALCIARGDATSFPSFDEDEYAKSVNTQVKSLNELLTEFEVVRKSTLMLFKSFTESDLLKQGTASSNLISVRAVAAILLGHEIHHIEIIKERYL